MWKRLGIKNGIDKLRLINFRDALPLFLVVLHKDLTQTVGAEGDFQLQPQNFWSTFVKLTDLCG